MGRRGRGAMRRRGREGTRRRGNCTDVLDLLTRISCHFLRSLSDLLCSLSDRPRHIPSDLRSLVITRSSQYKFQRMTSDVLESAVDDEGSGGERTESSTSFAWSATFFEATGVEAKDREEILSDWIRIEESIVLKDARLSVTAMDARLK